MFGSPEMVTNSPNRRRPLKHKLKTLKLPSLRLVSAVMAVLTLALATFGQGPFKVTLDDAIQLALQHNHTLLATRTTIQQSEAEEVTANLRPNPALFTDWEYLPLFGSPSHQNPNLYPPGERTSQYLHDNTEA